MRIRVAPAVAVFSVFALIGLGSAVHAGGTYFVEKITHVAMHQDGRMFIKWEGSPHFTCNNAENYGWVIIVPVLNIPGPDLRTLALSLYLQGLPAWVVTLDGGCAEGLEPGQFMEYVSTIYSPGG